MKDDRRNDACKQVIDYFFFFFEVCLTPYPPHPKYNNNIESGDAPLNIFVLSKMIHCPSSQSHSPATNSILLVVAEQGKGQHT